MFVILILLDKNLKAKINIFKPMNYLNLKNVLFSHHCTIIHQMFFLSLTLQNTKKVRAMAANVSVAINRTPKHIGFCKFQDL